MGISEFIIAEGNMCIVAAFMGMVLGFEYDLIRIFRRVFIHKKVWTMSVEDIVYWVIAAFQVFGVIYEHGDGVVRGFLVVIMVGGAVLYKQGIGRYLVVYISKALNCVFKPLKNAFSSVTMFIRVKYVAIKQAKCDKRVKRQQKRIAKKRSKKDEVRVKKRKGDAI